jgi:hypothetical protein
VQLAVLRATFQALAEMQTPGEVRHLDFEWPEPPKQANTHPQEPAPIIKYLQRHPWKLLRLINRDVPT